MKRISVSAAALAVAIAPGMAPAQELIELDEIVVTANRVATAEDRTGASVSVLTEAEIAAAGDVEVIDLLRRLPGVSATQTGPLGSNAALRIRGADTRYIAVYIDGIRVSDPTLTESRFEFGGLTSAGISRIELLRGSQSALYGGSAVGGVIAITTRRAEAEGLSRSASVSAGSHGTFAGSYSLARRGPDGEVALTLSHTRSDGFSAAAESAGNTEADGFEATRLSFSAEHRLSDTVTVGGALFWQTSESEYDGFDAVTFAPADADNVVEREEIGARVYAEIAAGRTDHLFDLSLYDTSRRFDEEGFISTFDGRRLTFGWQATTEVSDRLSFVYGADWTEEKARYSALPQGEETSRIYGAFAQALWAPTDRLDISASARIDETSNFGSFTSGRLALAWRPDDSLTLRAAIARGFRAPSIDERFGNYGFFVGNPDLEPEESLSYEIGAEKSFAGSATIAATLFRLEIDNLVTYDGVSVPNTLVNLPGESVRQGLELAAALPLTDRLTADFAYTYTDAVGPTGARLSLVPRHAVELGLQADLAPRLTGRVAARHVSDVVEGGLPGDDYTTVNLGLDYALTDRMDLSLRVENLFDEEYQLVRGYGTSGRAFHVGLSSRF